MGDTLIIGGKTYYNVPGFKAMDSNGDIQTYTKGGGSIWMDEDGCIVLDSEGDGGRYVNPVTTEKQINFLDYDGEIRYSYTAAEFANLSALPPNPVHEGKIAQGWNWTKAQIDAQLVACPNGSVWVGQQYTTEDGKTHIHIIISWDTPSDRRNMILRYAQTDAYGVEVDWDDGSALESHSATEQSLEHYYSEAGEYDITLDAVSGTMSFTNGSIGGGDSKVYLRTRIVDIAFGDNVTSVGEYGLYVYNGHAKMSAPSGMPFNGYYVFGCNYLLTDLIVPSGITAIPERMCRYCDSLLRTSVPAGITAIGVNAFYACISLRSITIPIGVTNIGENAFHGCNNLRALYVPSSVTSIGSNAFSDGAFGEFHFYSTTPPTLGSDAFYDNANTFTIYVPAASVNAYKTATNWSAYASYIQAEPS